MRSASGKLFIYEKAQLIEVICQVRFPTILSIEASPPAQFQDTIRGVFPRYLCRREKSAGKNGETQEILNHTFVSEDSSWKLNLTKSFFSLSTMRYRGWEDFASRLDEPLGQFIQIYHPAFFLRVGLRYVNAFSRKNLELEDRRWNDLLQPQYLGLMDDDGLEESEILKNDMDHMRKMDEHSAVKLHTGLARINRTVQTMNQIQTIRDPEGRFILDQDLFSSRQVNLPDVMSMLNRLHGHADRIYSEAITDVLHDAMCPVEL